MHDELDEQLQARLAEYVDGELDGRARAEVERELAARPGLRTLVTALMVDQNRLRTGLKPVPAPPELAEAFRARLERQALLDDSGGEVAGSISPRRRVAVPWAAVAATLMLTGGTGALVWWTLGRADDGGPGPIVLRPEAKEELSKDDEAAAFGVPAVTTVATRPAVVPGQALRAAVTSAPAAGMVAAETAPAPTVLAAAEPATTQIDGTSERRRARLMVDAADGTYAGQLVGRALREAELDYQTAGPQQVRGDVMSNVGRGEALADALAERQQMARGAAMSTATTQYGQVQQTFVVPDARRDQVERFQRQLAADDARVSQQFAYTDVPAEKLGAYHVPSTAPTIASSRPATGPSTRAAGESIDLVVVVNERPTTQPTTAPMTRPWGVPNTPRP